MIPKRSGHVGSGAFLPTPDTRKPRGTTPEAIAETEPMSNNVIADSAAASSAFLARLAAGQITTGASAKPWAPPTAPNALPAANDAPSPKPVTTDAGTGLHEGSIVPFAAPPLLVAECRPNKVLAKRFEADGTKRDYDDCFDFRYRELPANTFAELLAAISWVSSHPTMCVLRGVLRPEWPRADTAPDAYFYRRKNDRPGEPANITEGAFSWVVYDYDDTASPFDLAAPERSIRTWHATLPPELRTAQSAFFPSASAHVSSTVRGKLVVWYGSPITGEQARDFADLYRADASVGRCYQPNYFAAPVFADGAVDPLAAHRAPIMFAGNDATPPAPAALKAHRDRPAPVPLGECPPGDKGILAALGPAAAQLGKRFAISGHLGGIMRKLGFEREACAAILTDWIPANELEPRLKWALAAWDKDPDEVSGEAALRETVGNAHAAVIVEACTRAAPPPSPEEMEKAARLDAIFETANRLQKEAAAASSTPAPIAVALDNDPFRFMWSDGIFAPLEPPVYVIDQLVQRGSLVEIIAYGGSGKTWLIVEMGVSAALGRLTFGRFPSKPSRVKFIDFENGTDEMRRRVQAVAKSHGASTIQNLAVSSFPSIYLTNSRFEELLRPVAEQSDIIFIDTFKAASPGVDENDSNIRVGLDVLKRIASQTGCAIVVLAHAKKIGANKDDHDPRELARGSSAIYDAADTVFAVQYKEGEPLSVVQTKARLGRTAEPFLVAIEDLPGPTGLLGAGGVRVGGLERGEHAAAALSAGERRILDKLREVRVVETLDGGSKADEAARRLARLCGMKESAFAEAFLSLRERSHASPEAEGLRIDGKGRSRKIVYNAPTHGARLAPSVLGASQREP
jgi:AAA domain